MELDPKRLVYLSVGFFDYLREKLDEMSEEFVERGQQKGEDLREFVDDLVENIPFLRPKEVVEAEDGNGGAGLLEMLKDLDVKAMVNDLLGAIGLGPKESAGEMPFESTAGSAEQ